MAYGFFVGRKSYLRSSTWNKLGNELVVNRTLDHLRMYYQSKHKRKTDFVVVIFGALADFSTGGGPSGVRTLRSFRALRFGLDSSWTSGDLRTEL